MGWVDKTGLYQQSKDALSLHSLTQGHNFSYTSISEHALASQAVTDGGSPSPFAETAARVHLGRDSERYSSNRIGSAFQPSLVR